MAQTWEPLEVHRRRYKICNTYVWFKKYWTYCYNIPKLNILTKQTYINVSSIFYTIALLTLTNKSFMKNEIFNSMPHVHIPYSQCISSYRVHTCYERMSTIKNTKFRHADWPSGTRPGILRHVHSGCQAHAGSLEYLFFLPCRKIWCLRQTISFCLWYDAEVELGFWKKFLHLLELKWGLRVRGVADFLLTLR